MIQIATQININKYRVTKHFTLTFIYEQIHSKYISITKLLLQLTHLQIKTERGDLLVILCLILFIYRNQYFKIK